jgi:hypothetical protein
MRYLTTVQGSFHGRVVAARLGTEGILVELRGVWDGPYPLLGAVEVFVSEDQLELSREILLADAVDAAVDGDLVELDFHCAESAGGPSDSEQDHGPTGQRFVGPERAHRYQFGRFGAVVALMLVVALIVVGVVAVSG